jgi:predicted dehydrogenase
MSVNRREFLGTSAAAASAAALGLSLASSALADDKTAKDVSDVRVAQIGFNGQGKGHIQHNHKNLVALCDVDEKVLNGMAGRLKEQHGYKLDTYTDYRKLLERKDIDAVSIATPNHIHALVAIAAAQAGKHVYVEKPASYNIWEGRQMIQAARQNNRIMQCGTQSRSSTSLKEAVDFVQGGSLGKIKYALGTCYKPRPSIGKLDKPLEIPGTLNYDLWCGPAEKKDLYRKNVHYDWHWDFNTGNGDMGNQGIHQMDIARWFLGENTLAPRSISIGGRLGYEDAGNTPNTQIVYLDYAAAPLIFETRGLPRSKEAQSQWGESMDRYRGSRIGVIVQCENGYVLVPSYVEAFAYDNDGHELKHWNLSGDALGRHIRNFLSAVAANDASLLNADIQEGHLSSSLCHLGGISHQLGKTAHAGEISEQIKSDELLSISFDRMASHLRANGVDIDGSEGAITLGPWLELDPATEQFVGNDAATALRSRNKQREPFVIADLERNTVAKAG